MKEVAGSTCSLLSWKSNIRLTFVGGGACWFNPPQTTADSSGGPSVYILTAKRRGGQTILSSVSALYTQKWKKWNPLSNQSPQDRTVKPVAKLHICRFITSSCCSWTLALSHCEQEFTLTRSLPGLVLIPPLSSSHPRLWLMMSGWMFVCLNLSVVLLVSLTGETHLFVWNLFVQSSSVIQSLRDLLRGLTPPWCHSSGVWLLLGLTPPGSSAKFYVRPQLELCAVLLL